MESLFLLGFVLVELISVNRARWVIRSQCASVCLSVRPVVSVLVLVRVLFHDSNQRNSKDVDSAYSLSAEGHCSLLLLLQLLISASLSWKQFTKYKSNLWPIHASDFMWTVSCALSVTSVAEEVQVCVAAACREGKEQVWDSSHLA